MGMGSVDLAVLWPKNYGQFDVCYKPTSRLSQFASLGIPAVAYPFASYIDIFVRPHTQPKPCLNLALTLSPNYRNQPVSFVSHPGVCAILKASKQTLVHHAP